MIGSIRSINGARTDSRTGHAGAVLCIATGIASLICAGAAREGIPSAAVAPEHRSLSIVGKRPIDLEASIDAIDEPAPFSPAELFAWRQDPVFGTLEAVEQIESTLFTDSGAHRIAVWRATPGVLDLLALTDPIAGRLPAPSDPSRPGLIAEIALARSTAARLFTDPADAIDRPATLNADQVRIVGVLPDPPGEAFIGVDAWATFDPAEFKRLTPDDPLLDAPLLTGITSIEPPALTPAGSSDRLIVPLVDVVLGSRVQRSLRATALGAVLIFLASLTAASLLWLSAIVGRREELALRLALGSTRSELVRAVAHKAAIATTTATAFGMLASWWVIDAAGARITGTIPGGTGIAIQSVPWSTVASAAMVCVAALTLIPIPTILRAHPAWCIRGLPPERAAPARLTASLGVLALSAIATAILGIAIALTNQAALANRPPVGMDLRGVGVIRVGIPWWRIPADSERWRIVLQTLQEVQATGIFRAVAAADNAPILGPEFRAIEARSSADPGQRPRPDSTPVLARLHSVTPEALQILGVNTLEELDEPTIGALLKLSASEVPALPVRISESLADALLESPDAALARTLALGDAAIPALIRAVVSDTAGAPDAFDAGGPEIWLPMPIGWEGSAWSLLLRLDGHPENRDLRRDAAAEAARRAVIESIDDATLSPIVWLDEHIDRRARIYWIAAWITLGAAAAAISMAALAAAGRTRIRLLSEIDELRVLIAFALPRSRVAWRAAAPALAAAMLGVPIGTAVCPWILSELMPELHDHQTLSVAATLAIASVGVAVSVAFAAIVTTRFFRIDPGALLRSL
ncbi:MAG: ABC transporter permease [Phycisphaerales bacterium]